MTDKIKAQAVHLRKAGHTYKEIVANPHQPKSTVYGWTQQVKLTDLQEEKILQRQYQARLRQVGKLAEMRKQKTKMRGLEISDEAKGMVEEIELTILQKRLLCCLLIWCEGEKSNDGVKFINSDPDLVTTFF